MLLGSVNWGAATQVSIQCPFISGETSAPGGRDGLGMPAAWTPAANQPTVRAAPRAPPVASGRAGDVPANPRSTLLTAGSGHAFPCLRGQACPPSNA